MRKRVLSALLVFCMVLTLLPGTALAANYWQNLSRLEAAQTADGMLNRTSTEDVVLIYTRGATAAYENYAEANQIKVACYSGSEQFSEMFSLIKDYEWGTSVSFPMISAYNGVTRSYETITGQGGMADFEALLDRVGIPSDSGTASSQPLYSSNAGAQNYLGYGAQWAQPVKSYLYENAVGGVSRVEYYGNAVIVEDYDSSYRFLSRKEIHSELPIWGGFFAGATSNFLIFGKENPSQSNSAEVVRIVKYSKDWQRQGSYSLNGANTTVPFDAGSVRCTELNGDLYVRTCHEMYTSSDGKNHQSNMTIVVHESDMSLKEAHYAVVGGRPDNYTSHSFNQFILTDSNGKVVMVDHGDAYARAISIAQYGGGNSIILNIPGMTGANATGTSVGGLAETSSGYVTAYTYDGVGTGTGNSNRNVYLAYTSKDGLKNSTPVQVTPGKGTYSNPVLAPTSLNGGYLLWNDASGALCYTTYSVDGSVGSTQTASGLLSDCQPISHDGKMVWYTTNSSAPVFYTLDESGVRAINASTAEKATPAVKANNIEAAVGAALPEITGTATYNGSPVAGTWSFVGTAPSTATANVFENVRVKFVPTDTAAYSAVETTITVTIVAVPVEKVTPTVTAADITAVEGSTLTITGTAKDGDKDVEGTWSFVDAAPTAVGKHENVKVKFVPKDAETYNEAETTITVTITAKPAEKVTPALTAADITAVEGSTLTITGTAKDGDKDVEGTWSFVDAAPTAVGKHENVKVKFVPKDAETYNEAETTITVTITAKPAEKVTPVLTAENITAVVGSELVITGTAKDGDKVVEGTWSFVGAAPTAVGTYRGVKVKFVPADTAAYNEAETAITVTITPAPVEPVAPTVTVQDITVDYTGTPVADSAIRGTANVPGRWSFVGAVPTAVGVHTVTVRFTPSNTVNYLTVEKAITLTINRASQALVITSPAVVRYDSRLTLTTNSPAGLVTYTVTDGTGRAEIAGDVLTPLAVGTVTVTANRAATETLDAASATQVITIEPVPVDQIDVPSGSYPDLIITDGRASSFAVDVTRAMTYRHLYETLFNRGELRLARTGADMSMSLEEINPYDTYLLEWWPNSTTRLEITVNPRENEENYISINTSDGGGVIPNVRRAETGERVILYVHPEAGYEMDSLTVTDGRGRQISCRSLGNDSYSFSMPASRVNVDVDFVKSQPNAPAEDDIYNQPFTGLGTPGISGIVLNPAAMPFTDVKGPDWFYNYVEYMWKHYLMSGTSETRFDPNVTTSRAMIWTIMARMNNVRTDINPGSTWYEKGMLWAMEKGITDGSNAMGDITREQLATMLWRNAGSPAAGGDLSRFSDAGSVSAYALNAVRWAAGNGILSGINGRIEPQGTATRAQVAAMIARYGDKTVR